MRGAVRTYFSRLFEEEFKVRPILDGLEFKRLIDANRQMIETVFRG